MKKRKERRSFCKMAIRSMRDESFEKENERNNEQAG